MKTVLIFACDPGGANTVIPLVLPLQERGYKIRVYGKNSALERYARANLTAVDIREQIGETRQQAVTAFLIKDRPDFIITGTSAEDFTEKYLWKAAEQLEIPCFAILDQWVNYGIRFSPWGLSNCALYEASRQHSYLPTRIIVMDTFARDEMVRSGIASEERILALGQPYFETLFSRSAQLPSRETLRNHLDIGLDEFVITFVSEPLSSDYKENPDRGEYWGFTERTTFRSLLGAVDRAITLTGLKTRLLVKRHPRETSDHYHDLLQKASSKLAVSQDCKSDPLELIHVSDLVCGMSSMMLIEAVIVGTPVMSILVGLKRESPFVLDRQGIISSVRSESELDTRLMAAFCGVTADSGHFDVAKKPVAAIIDVMESFI